MVYGLLGPSSLMIWRLRRCPGRSERIGPGKLPLMRRVLKAAEAGQSSPRERSAERAVGHGGAYRE